MAVAGYIAARLLREDVVGRARGVRQDGNVKPVHNARDGARARGGRDWRTCALWAARDGARTGPRGRL